MSTEANADTPAVEDTNLEAPEGQEGTDAPEGGASPTATPAQKEAARKLRLKGIDGDEEREYDETTVTALARRGKQASRLVSLADKRAQEADAKAREIEAKLARLKNPNEARKFLRELGLDVRAMSEAEIMEAMEEEKLSPEEKKIRALEAREQERLRKDEEAKSEAQRQKDAEEEEAETNALSNLFVEVMQKTGLKVGSAKAAFHRVAQLYQSAHATGTEVDPDLAAAHVRQTLMDEHKALLSNPDGSLNLDALSEWLGEDGWRQVQKHSLEKWRARKKTGGAAPVVTTERKASATGPRAPQANGKTGPAPGTPAFWRQLEAGR